MLAGDPYTLVAFIQILCVSVCMILGGVAVAREEKGDGGVGNQPLAKMNYEVGIVVDTEKEWEREKERTCHATL